MLICWIQTIRHFLLTEMWLRKRDNFDFDIQGYTCEHNYGNKSADAKKDDSVAEFLNIINIAQHGMPSIQRLKKYLKNYYCHWPTLKTADDLMKECNYFIKFVYFTMKLRKLMLKPRGRGGACWSTVYRCVNKDSQN